MGETGRTFTLHGGPLRNHQHHLDAPYPMVLRVRIPTYAKPFTWLGERDTDVSKTAVYTFKTIALAYQYSHTVSATADDGKHAPLTVIIPPDVERSAPPVIRPMPGRAAIPMPELSTAEEIERLDELFPTRAGRGLHADLVIVDEVPRVTGTLTADDVARAFEVPERAVGGPVDAERDFDAGSTVYVSDPERPGVWVEVASDENSRIASMRAVNGLDYPPGRPHP